MYAPGSPSSALTTTYLGAPSAFLVDSHLVPVEKPAPPRPRKPDCFISSSTSIGVIFLSALASAEYPPRAM